MTDRACVVRLRDCLFGSFGSFGHMLPSRGVVNDLSPVDCTLHNAKAYKHRPQAVWRGFGHRMSRLSYYAFMQ
jgi:hypothetical protein